MFTSIELKNFKVYDEVVFTPSDKKGNPLSYVFLYGENGSGKSSILESIDFLSNSFQTLFTYDRIDKILKEVDLAKVDFTKVFGRLKRTIKELAEEKIMIGTTEDMVLTYTFLINKKKVKYLLRFDSECNLIEESLWYAYDKRIASVFTFTKDTVKLNKQLFLNSNYKNEILDIKMKYWGLHTFLSILFSEFGGVNKEYWYKNVDTEILEVITTLFQNLIGNLKGVSTGSFISLYSPSFKGVDELESGTIQSKNMESLQRVEHIITNLFQTVSPSVNYAFYKLEKDSDEDLKYKLYLNKKIAGKDRDIPFDHESRGTRKLLLLLPYFVKYYNDQVCVLDEMDAGIHDLTFAYLVSGIMEKIESHGQIIASCHNTKIINHLNAHNVFLIQVNPDTGTRSIVSFAELDKKYRKENNQERLYLDHYLSIHRSINLDFDKWQDA